MDKTNLYQDGKERYGPRNILLENILILTQLILGALLFQYHTLFGVPALSIAFLCYAFVMLGFVLRKHLCTHCYYYGKNCHCGWGILSKAMYKEGSGDYKLGGRLALVTWSSFMILPLISFLLAIALHKAPFLREAVTLAAFLVVVAINMGLHVKDCKACKMRAICPGSAAKKLV